MQADKCYIFSDVDGVYTADPNKVINAKKLASLTYEEMQQMAKDWGLDDLRETILPKDSHKPDMNVSTTTELPFDTDKED